MKNNIVFISNALGGIKTFQDTLIRFFLKKKIECTLIDEKPYKDHKKKLRYYKVNVLNDMYNTFLILNKIKNKNKSKNKNTIFIFSNPVIFVLYFLYIKFFFDIYVHFLVEYFFYIPIKFFMFLSLQKITGQKNTFFQDFLKI